MAETLKRKRDFENVSVYCFSPVSIELGYAKLWNCVRKISPPGPLIQSEQGPDSFMCQRLEVASLLPSDVLQAAVSPGDSWETIQKLLEGSGLHVSENYFKENVVAVSKLKYSFEWPGEMRNPPLRLTKGLFRLSASPRCYLTRSIHDKVIDTLVVNVTRAEKYDVNIRFVGLLEGTSLPLLEKSTLCDIRGELQRVHFQIAKSPEANLPISPLRKLGIATLCIFDSVDATNLEEFAGRRLPGDMRVDVAKHVCQFGMNESGGYVRATTLMESFGFCFEHREPVDMNFHEYPHGYLTFMEMVDRSSSEFSSPVCMVAAWINRPSAFPVTTTK